jgi:UDPglucose 6-dehydrogenase
MQVCVIGTGFVGVVSAAVYASFGNTVFGLDIDQSKIDKLKQGIVPFYEPGLTELLLAEQQKGNLHFTTSYQEAVSQADVIMIAVGTPSAPDGQADLKYVMMAAESLALHLKDGTIVVVKSTVPPGTLKKVEQHIKLARQSLPEQKYHLASMPEFLREGSAVHDTLHPDRVVIGASEEKVFETLSILHEPLQAPIVKISPESAQMAKYAANSYLATRITFINQIADLCDKNGADIQDVIQAIGYDKRIGQHYWYPGLGYGGSCFPKDVKELAAYSRSVGEGNNLLNKINEINEERPWKLLKSYAQTVGGWNGKRVAVLGLSFKPNTDDMREAPSMKLVPYLLSEGATVTGYDPKAVYPQGEQLVGFSQTATLKEAVVQADAVIAVVEWPEITGFDFAQTRETSKEQFFIDCRNQLDPQKLAAAGYHYIAVGRPSVAPQKAQ